MEELIKIEHVYRHYGDYCAVHDLSFTLHRGEVLGFLGPNGAGKSTTMSVISGNLAPTSGSVQIAGIDLLEQPVQAKQSIGYLPEHPPLYRDMTVDEYLGYCARLHLIPTNELNAGVTRAKQRCGLSAVGGRLIGHLSKGYQQRVGIAQAIVHRPPVVILDEPSVGLDPNQIRHVRGLIRELGENHGVILSTHLLAEVQFTCDRVLILNEGHQIFAEALGDVNGSDHAPALIIGLAHSPDPDDILALPGVSEVTALQPGRFRLSLETDIEFRAQIAEAVVGKGWGLLEMACEVGDLERIFVALTTGEAA